MRNQVLIVAPAATARTPAEIARSLQFEPVIVPSIDEAVALIGAQPFSLIAVADDNGSNRVREAAELKRPRPRVVVLPDEASDERAVRSLLTRYLDPTLNVERPRFSEDRYRTLMKILESFAATLEVREIVRRIVTITREELGADRAWLLNPVTEETEYAKVAVAVNGPAMQDEPMRDGLVPLGGSRDLIRRAMESPLPITVHRGEADLDAELAREYGICSELLQILRPSEGEPWAFGLDQCTGRRDWSSEEIALFGEIGRVVTLALNNTLLQARAVRDIARMNAVLDQIPESAAIYDAQGALERMNSVAQRELSSLFGAERDARLRSSQHRYPDGKPLSPAELPSVRAARGESLKSDYIVRDTRSGDDRVVNLKAAPLRDEKGRIIGSFVLARDVTDERQKAEREALRRRRAECLANLGVEALTVQPSFDNLDVPAQRVAKAIVGTAMIYFYHPSSGELHIVGAASVGPTAAEVNAFREYVSRKPYHAGEGVPGTVFQIGRPLFFSDVRGTAVLDFARADDDRAIIEAMGEQTVIACPIESYGDRIGALVIARSDARRNLDADDLEFAQTVAERVGAAAHIHKLTRISQEGHRAAEELARSEVDARVRLETVLETAPVGVAVFSADELRFELANARFLDFAAGFGKISPDTKVIGLYAADVLPGFDRTLKTVADSGEARFDEAWQVGSRTEPRYINRIISTVRGRFSGNTQSITVLIQDVTDQVKAKQEIEALADMMAERSARLDSILSSMTDGLWVYDIAGNVVDVNKAALTMFGFGSRTEAIEQGSFRSAHLRFPDGKVISPDDFPQARALRGETVPDYLAIGSHAISGKDLDLSIAAAPIESGGVVGAVLVIRDITALQELDRKKDEFLSVASHELRTPLTTIKGYTQLLSQTVHDLPQEERSTYLTAVLGEIDRMMGLISELLDVSRIETNRLQIHPQLIRWREFLERRASAFRVQNAVRNIRVETEIPETLFVTVDPDRMRQVIDNVLSNAVKYSPEGSDIEVYAALEGDCMVSSVIDYGIGIPKDELPQLFERFHRARNVSSRYYGGLGLGLYISKAIVEAHRGSISIVSEEGKGTKVTIRIPLPAPS
jgi:PAS domain S-box-containing protein